MACGCHTYYISTHEETPPKKVLIFALIVIHIFKLIMEAIKHLAKRIQSLLLIEKKNFIMGKNFPGHDEEHLSEINKQS